VCLYHQCFLFVLVSIQSPSNPAQSSTVYSGHNLSINNNQDYSQPTQVEGDEHNESQTVHEMPEYHDQWQADDPQAHVLRLQNRSYNEQPHECSAAMSLKQQQQLQQSLLRTQAQQQHLQSELERTINQLNSEREKSFKLQQRENDHMQVIHHLAMQVDIMSGQLKGRVASLPECYQMNRRPHGIAVIINNSEFYNNELFSRPGSQVDEDNLRVTWEYLQYDVRILKNVTASELTRQLMQISQQSHESYDSFVCCILSHGDLNVVCGADGRSVKIDKVAGLFKGNFCPTLVNKPKLFFLQACRGKDGDGGVPTDQRDGDEEDSFRYSLPREADFLFSYATSPGNVSWRSPRYGTWYVSSLCQVLVDNASQLDLLSMLTMVNSKVLEAFTNQGYKQCPAPVTLLHKQVWFFGN